VRPFRGPTNGQGLGRRELRQPWTGRRQAKSLSSIHFSLHAKVTVPQRSARKLTVIDFRPLVHRPLGLLNKPHMAY